MERTNMIISIYIILETMKPLLILELVLKLNLVLELQPLTYEHVVFKIKF